MGRAWQPTNRPQTEPADRSAEARSAFSSPVASRHVIIIGGGVGGLAAAIRLSASGLRVTLVEKNDRVGGKLNRWEAAHPDRPGQRWVFDTGPSLLTLPFVFEDLFAAAGTSMAAELYLVQLDPISRFVWADGTTFELRAEQAATLEQVARISPGDVDGWRRFMARGRHIWELAGELFLMNSPETLMRRGELSAMDGLRMLSLPLRIGMLGRYARLVDRHVRHPRLREVLYQYATYSGASPFRAPATLGVIPYVETGFGGWYIRGGMYALAEALRRVGERLGVVYRTSCVVRRIVTSVTPSPFGRGCRVREAGEGLGEEMTNARISTVPAVRHSGFLIRHSQPPSPGPAGHPLPGGEGVTAVRGVELEGGGVIAADAVLANSDVLYTYRALIDAADRPHWPDAKIDRTEPGGSGMVLLLGVEGTYPQLAHHTKFMPRDYRDDLRAMFGTRTVPRDPCIYVCASTRTDATQAPPDCENLFVLTSAPALFGRGRDVDWAAGADEYRDRIIATLERDCGLTDLSKRIVVEKRYTPRDLQSCYNAHAGSIYGIGSNSRRSAFLRPPNRDKRIAGLYFAGGATHPGGGLPLVALSGKIAAEMISAEMIAAANPA